MNDSKESFRPEPARPTSNASSSMLNGAGLLGLGLVSGLALGFFLGRGQTPVAPIAAVPAPIVASNPAPIAEAPVAEAPVAEAPAPVSQPAEVTPQTVPAAETVAASPADAYELKVYMHPFAPAQFDIILNGSTLGSFDAMSSRNITPLVRRGQNEVTIKTNKTQRDHDGLFTNVTIGVKQGQGWNTVIKHSIAGSSPSSEKKYTFTAR